MITTANEYYATLAQIQDENFPVQAVLVPSDEKIYEIDLNTRSVSVPEFLSVETDHKSETVYFKIDRFCDYMDLSRTACVIQYINAKKESHYYPVPFYDCVTFNAENKMIIPWNIDGAATVAPGTVQFTIRFYKMERGEFVYNLITRPAHGKILHGMTGKFLPEDYQIASDVYLQIQEALLKLNQRVVAQLYWLTPEELETTNPTQDDINRKEEIENIFKPLLPNNEV